MMNTLQGTI